MLTKFIIAASIAASSTMAVDVNSKAESFARDDKPALPDCDSLDNNGSYSKMLGGLCLFRIEDEEAVFCECK